MRIFTTLIAALLVSMSVVAQHTAVDMKVVPDVTASRIQGSKMQRAVAETVTLKKAVSAFFTADNTVSNYYIMLAESEDVMFNSATSTVEAKNTRVLFLDLYSQETATTILVSGSYTAAVGELQSGNYNADYTYYGKYNFNGKQSSYSDIVGPVEVTRLDNNNNYHIEATAEDGTTFVYDGRINFIDSNIGTYVYPQIQSDIEVNPTGGLAFYNGDLYDSKTGEMYVNLFDCEFDEETGAMLEPGFDVALELFNKLFGNSANAAVVPGVYTVARNFKKETFFPGMEIDYMGTTVVFGSYVKRRKTMSNTDDDYDFTYITNGTVTVTENEDGTLNFDLDLTTADGFEVKGKATGITVKIIDVSDPNKNPSVSNLEQDVQLDLSYVKTARAYNNGTENGCRRFLVDIGSPSGKDGKEGDIFRIEFLERDGEGVPREGVYEMMEYDHLYTHLYEPFKLVQGYFVDGGLDGTRYMHFAEGRYNVMDLLAPAVDGKISLEKVAGTENYHFIIDVFDDAGFEISGEWTGPIEFLYDIEAITSGVDDVLADTSLTVGYIDADHIAISPVGETDLVNLYAPDGRLVFSQTGASQMNIGHLAQGMYILKVANYETVKIVKK